MSGEQFNCVVDAPSADVGYSQGAADLLRKKSLKQVLEATGSILEIGSPT